MQPAPKRTTTVRLEPAHDFVVDVVAKAEAITPAEAVRRIIERYARLVVDEEPDEETGEVYGPTLWQEAREAARHDGQLDEHWIAVHGDRAA